MTGLVTVGGIPLWEARSAEQSADTVTLAGRESIADFRGTGAPALTVAQVHAAHDNVLGLRGMVTSAVFGAKAYLSGFYRVTDSSSRPTKAASGAIQETVWSLTLERVGSERDVEIESRVPTIGRLDEIPGVQTPVFWHAPAVGAGSYLTGATVPSGVVTRQSADGPVTVYTGIPAGVAPRWTSEVEEYLDGSARLMVAGIRRVGKSTPTAAVWDVHNGLVRLSSPGQDAAFSVACWDAGGWRSDNSYRVTVDGAPLAGQPDFTVLRSAPEEVIVRLTYATSPGRATVDLGLRRGSRFVTGTIKRHSAAAIGVARTTAEAATVQTGGLRATAADADGNRFVLGSSRLVTTVADPAAISKAGVLSFDFFAGHEVDAVPAAGDAFADLLGQYLGGAGSESARVVRRGAI